MDERIREPDDPDAIDRDAYRTPERDDPRPEPDVDDPEPMMRFPGEDAPGVVGDAGDLAAGTEAGTAGETAVEPSS